MRRLLPALVLAILVACSGGDEPGPSTSPTTSASTTVSPSSGSATPSTTPTLSPSASPAPEPDLQLPTDAPISVDDPAQVAQVAAGDLAPLAPPGASIASSEVDLAPEDPLDQIALVWRRGEDPFAPETGFVLWQRFDQTWAAVYAFTNKPRTGVLGIDITSGELTGDEIDDLLTLERSGGSGACGRWRVIAPTTGSATELFRREACDTEIAIAGSALELREAVYALDDPHCCPSAYRTSTLEWDGERFVVTSTVEEPT